MNYILHTVISCDCTYTQPGWYVIVSKDSGLYLSISSECIKKNFDTEKLLLHYVEMLSKYDRSKDLAKTVCKYLNINMLDDQVAWGSSTDQIKLSEPIRYITSSCEINLMELL